MRRSSVWKVISLVLAGILSYGLFILMLPTGKHVFAGFYPVPWTMIATSIIILLASFVRRKSDDWQYACASFAAGLGWLAWRMAVVLDHTCISGWCGFLSLACLLSLYFPKAARKEWCLLNWVNLSIIYELLLVAGIALFAIACLVYPVEPHLP